ncbi:hypothetical protein DF3PB_2360003 [uncultured Defluviicoccus sp.]|uniref:Uncharacterized protein n=1 Tax=metagenome TaxID=256318 RepID=A0A380TDE5_9ZZZZ|nr:hypothetical protein DF3PB_2360003 [uncultured Defluviicoccus sp.]
MTAAAALDRRNLAGAWEYRPSKLAVSNGCPEHAIVMRAAAGTTVYERLISRGMRPVVGREGRERREVRRVH